MDGTQVKLQSAELLRAAVEKALTSLLCRRVSLQANVFGTYDDTADLLAAAAELGWQTVPKTDLKTRYSNSWPGSSNVVIYERTAAARTLFPVAAQESAS